MTDIAVKGERDGIVIVIGPDGDFDEIASAVVAYLERGGAFFKGSYVTLDFGPRVLTDEQAQAMREILSDQGVELRGLRNSDEPTPSTPGTPQISISLEDEGPSETSESQIAPPFLHQGTATVAFTEVPDGSQPALIVHRTLRNGQAVRHPDGIVIMGDVNPGAEVVAGGDVIVVGALRGVVHAGASGNDNCIVCALDLAPTQLRISGQIARPPEEKHTGGVFTKRPKRQPEIARIRDGVITVEPWPR
jgi:septum site-determining protein MinC